MEGVYEHFFFLKHYGGWSFTEAYNLPIGLREWFVNRLSEQMEAETNARKASYSSNNVQTLSSTNQPPPPSSLDVK